MGGSGGGGPPLNHATLLSGASGHFLHQDVVRIPERRIRKVEEDLLRSSIDILVGQEHTYY